jgi:hypothetical protein
MKRTRDDDPRHHRERSPSRWRPLSIGFALSVAACSHSSQEPAADTGTATLTWNRVTKNTSGANLTGLAGYKIHYGRSASLLTNVVTLPNPDLTSYQVTHLSPGTWYFAVTAYSSDGRESALSPVASKAVK